MYFVRIIIETKINNFLAKDNSGKYYTTIKAEMPSLVKIKIWNLGRHHKKTGFSIAVLLLKNNIFKTVFMLPYLFPLATLFFCHPTALSLDLLFTLITLIKTDIDYENKWNWFWHLSVRPSLAQKTNYLLLSYLQDFGRRFPKILLFHSLLRLSKPRT